MNISKKDKIFFLIEEMEKVNISKEDIIGMLSMIPEEEQIDEMIRFMVNTPNLTEEKVVRALAYSSTLSIKRKVCNHGFL